MVNKANDINDLTGEIIGAAIEVHKTLGPGLLESIYEDCLCAELSLRGIPFERQKQIPIHYKGIELSSVYRLDVIAADHAGERENRCAGRTAPCDYQGDRMQENFSIRL